MREKEIRQRAARRPVGVGSVKGTREGRGTCESPIYLPVTVPQQRKRATQRKRAGSDKNIL